VGLKELISVLEKYASPKMAARRIGCVAKAYTGVISAFF